MENAVAKEVCLYRKKPATIEAIQLDWSTWSQVCDFMKEDGGKYFGRVNVDKDGKPTGDQGLLIGLIIKTDEGDMLAKQGDWIIRGVKGEFYACKPDVFEMTYEKLSEE